MIKRRPNTVIVALLASFLTLTAALALLYAQDALVCFVCLAHFLNPENIDTGF
ncbi:hypothetical protein ACFIOY_19340 [Bradyrhizobium sp. TZ2]